MFACPNCRTRLAKQPSAQGPRWVCGACGGRAVHLPSLRCAPAGVLLRRLWRLARRDDPSHRKRACPICDHLMATVPTIAVPGTRDPLRLDFCLYCQFVWFDATEHETWTRASAQAATDFELPAETRIALARLPRDPAPSPDEREEEPDRVPLFQLSSREEPFEWKYLVCMLGVPVEVNPPPLHRPPVVTWTLAGVIALVSLCGFAAIQPAAQAWGFIPAAAWRLGGLTLLTSFFLHVDPFHLVGNLYYLLVFGDNVEDLLGRLRYALLLFTATVAGDLLHAAIRPSSTVPVIGASGGISAVIVYYGLLFPHGRLRLFRFRFIDINVRAALLLWVVLQLIGVLVQAHQGTAVAYGAHVGGALTALVFWSVYGRGESRLLSIATPRRRLAS